MRLPFLDYHVLAFFRGYDPSCPLDLALHRYFAAHKALGPNERKNLGNTVYGMVRWEPLFAYHAPSRPQQLPLWRLFEQGKFIPSKRTPEHVLFGTPPFLYEKLVFHYGKEKGQALALLLNEEAPVTIRANTLKTSREALLELWGRECAVEPCEDAPEGIRFAHRVPLFSSPAFQDGLFEVQDEGSQQVAALVKAKPGDLVLDYCSGSGGKALAFAPKMEGKGQIFLHDIRASALTSAKKRFKRAGIQNGQFLSPGHPQLGRLRGKCHWVLADVPCSGTGTLRRNPEQKLRLSAALLERLAAEQRAIFEEALSYLHPKGTLVYATCSLLPEENEAQVAYFLEKHPSLTLQDPPLFFLPTSGGKDAFFAAVFRKKET